LYEDDCRPKEQKYPDYIVALSVFISGSWIHALLPTTSFTFSIRKTTFLR
jgi:hypothetical protein